MRFAPKAVQGLRISGDLIGQEFQGDEAAELGVLSLIDDTHTATAELLDDAVVRDGLADHWWANVMARSWQVNEGRGVADVTELLAKNRHYTQNPPDSDTSLCPIRGVSPRLSARSSSSYYT